MTPHIAQTIASFCLIAGTFLLAIEAIGRERALRVESAIQKISLGAERGFADFLAWMTAPWKKVEALPLSEQPNADESTMRKRLLWPEKLPRWCGPAFLTLTFLSLIIFRLAVKRFGEKIVTIVCLSSWLGAILTEIIVLYSIDSFQSTLKNHPSVTNKLKLLVLSATIAVAGLLFGVTALITFLSCWPAAFIFLIFVVIYLLSTCLRRIIDFRV